MDCYVPTGAVAVHAPAFFQVHMSDKQVRQACFIGACHVPLQGGVELCKQSGHGTQNMRPVCPSLQQLSSISEPGATHQVLVGNASSMLLACATAARGAPLLDHESKPAAGAPVASLASHSSSSTGEQSAARTSPFRLLSS